MDGHESLRKLFVIILLCLFLSIKIAPGFAASESEASQKISEAQNAIDLAYEAASDAEKAGANITDLLTVLNEAGELLSKASFAYASKDFDSAFENADLSKVKLDGLVERANAQEKAAAQQAYSDLMLYVVGPLVGSGILVFGCFTIWNLLKMKMREGWKHDLLNFSEFRTLFITATLFLALLVSSPALSRLLVLPSTESFTEFWILDQNRTAENYPSTISSNHEYSVFLGIANRLGYCAYYTIETKFRNQTQPSPNTLNRTSSSLPALYNITAFVADEGVRDIPLTFSFDYEYNGTLLYVALQSLRLNNITLDMTEYTITWNSTRDGFYGSLFFELWIYNAAADVFQYHERFVGLWLNMAS